MRYDLQAVTHQQVKYAEGVWVGIKVSVDFTSWDSPKPKIFTGSHLDRPECLCQLSFCSQNIHI